MSRFQAESEPSIIPVRANARLTRHQPSTLDENGSPRALEDTRPRRTFTGAIGAICLLPLRAIIAACVALRIHPHILTLVGVIINAIDDFLCKGDQMPMLWSISRINHLGSLLKLARDSGRVVVLASDHGHVWHRPDAKSSGRRAAAEYLSAPDPWPLRGSPARFGAQ